MSRVSKQRRGRPKPTKTETDPVQTQLRAESHLARGEIDLACQLLAQTPNISATDQGRRIWARAFEAQALARWDKPARALESLDRALSAAPHDPELQWLRGTLLRRLGRLKSAVTAMDGACHLSAGNPALTYETALTHLAAGGGPPLPASLTSVMEASGAKIVQALMAAASGDLVSARSRLQDASRPVEEILRAMILLAEGKADEALPTLEKYSVDESLPGLARAYSNFYLGLAHLRQRHFGDALSVLETALDLGLPMDLVQNYLAYAFNQLVIEAVLRNDLTEATNWLTRLGSMEGPEGGAARENVAYALSLRGQELARAGDYAGAADLWAQALEITPRDAALRQNLAVALERADREDEAIPHWRELVRQMPRPAGKLKAGGAVDQSETEDNSLRAHIQAVAHRHLADLYLQEDDAERAVAEMEKVLAILPDDHETRRELARLYMEEWRIEKAILHYEKLVATQSKAISDYVELGSAHELRGHRDRAIDILRSALALEPENSLVRQVLGLALATRVRQNPAAATALDDAQQAIGLLPKGDTRGIIAQAAALLAQGNRKEAQKLLEKSVKQASDKSDAAIEVGHVYWQAGERDLAIASWANAAKKARGEPLHLARLTEAWARAGELERCKESLIELLKKHKLIEAIGAVETIIASPESRPFFRQVLASLASWASRLEERMFVARALLRAGDIQAARPLVNTIAQEAVETDNTIALQFATELDYEYRYRLLDRKVTRNVLNWLDHHPIPEDGSELDYYGS